MEPENTKKEKQEPEGIKKEEKLEERNNLGVIYTELQKYDLAAQNFNKALVFYESSNNREKIAGVYHNVGAVFQQQKRYLKTLIYLDRSVELP